MELREDNTPDHVETIPAISRARDNGSSQKALVEMCLQTFCNLDRLGCLLPEISGSIDGPGTTLVQCGNAVVSLLFRLAKSISGLTGSYELVVQRLNDLIALSYEKFYAFPFKDVPACWRELFREASLLKFSALAVKDVWGQKEACSSKLPTIPPLCDAVMDDMVRTIDMALIMAGPPPSLDTRDAISAVLGLLESCNMVDRGDERSTKRRKLNCSPDHAANRFPSGSVFAPAISNHIPRISSPSFESFEQHMQNPKDHCIGSEPIIITGVLDSWPARGDRPWNNPNYLLSKTIEGRRLVPIETGRSYVDNGWGQTIITFKEFLNQYILLGSQNSVLATGYLAQHDLFAQIPSLRNDIAIPDYCYTSPPPPHNSSPLAPKHSEMPQLEDPLLNAWFGPAGTITPLHTDPYHNILAQVVGRKYIRLYAPGEGNKIYPRSIEDGGVDMSNTSAVDIGVLAGWDGTVHEQKKAHESFPLFNEAQYVDCILNEGECLYIPVGWWHYVRSLSISFSVSFWFN